MAILAVVDSQGVQAAVRREEADSVQGVAEMVRREPADSKQSTLTAMVSNRIRRTATMRNKSRSLPGLPQTMRR
jgi:hypothetical protein